LIPEKLYDSAENTVNYKIKFLKHLRNRVSKREKQETVFFFKLTYTECPVITVTVLVGW